MFADTTVRHIETTQLSIREIDLHRAWGKTGQDYGWNPQESGSQEGDQMSLQDSLVSSRDTLLLQHPH